MKRRTGIRAFFIFLTILLISVAMLPVMSASDEKCADANVVGIDVTVPEPMVVPSDEKLPSLGEKDEGVIIDNTTTYLTYWNERMKWGLSEEEIEKDSRILEEKVLVRHYDADDDSYHIKDLGEFGEEMGPVLGLTSHQIMDFVRVHREQLVIDRQNYESPPRW